MFVFLSDSNGVNWIGKWLFFKQMDTNFERPTQQQQSHPPFRSGGSNIYLVLHNLCFKGIL